MLVLGHTKCGAVYGATKTFLDAQGPSTKAGSALQGLLQDLGVVAQQAQEQMGPGADSDAIAAHAVKVNVFHTMNFLLSFSKSIREPPSMSSGAAADHDMHGVRTGADIAVKPEAALKLLQQGNERFAAGAPTAAITSKDMRQAWVKCGQAPRSAILGCADSRVPVDTVFDAMPGDLFVLRKAGNTCTHATRWSRSRHH